MNWVWAPGVPSIVHLQVLVQYRSTMASKDISKLPWSRPPTVSPNSLHYSLQVRTIINSKCISKLVWLRPASTSPNTLNYGLQVSMIIAPTGILPKLLNHTLHVYLWTRSITASKLAWGWPPNAYLQPRSITASKCIAKLAWLCPPSSHEHGLQAHLQTPSIRILECISKFTQSWHWSVSPNTLH